MKKYILIFIFVSHTTFAINPWILIGTFVTPPLAPLIVPKEYVRYKMFIAGCATISFLWSFTNCYSLLRDNQGQESMHNFDNVTIAQLQEILRKLTT